MKKIHSEEKEDKLAKERPAKGGFGTASLVLGIIGVVFCWIPLNLMGVLAVVFGGIALHKGQRYGKPGLILGIVSLASWILILIIGLLA